VVAVHEFLHPFESKRGKYRYGVNHIFIIGAIAGFTAGLFGVGGGLIIVPILYIVFTQLQYDPSVIMHMAVGTSLATIIVTSISSVMAHHQRGAVLWDVVRNLAPGL